MNVFSLTIPLAALLTCPSFCPSAFFAFACFFLNASTGLHPLRGRTLLFRIIVCAHRFRFPLADTFSHQLGAVGFPNIFPLDKQIEHTDIAAVVIHVELASSKPGKQSWAHIPAPLKGEPVPRRGA